MGYGYITKYITIYCLGLTITYIKICEKVIQLPFLKQLKDGTFEEGDLLIDWYFTTVMPYFHFSGISCFVNTTITVIIIIIRVTITINHSDISTLLFYMISIYC